MPQAARPAQIRSGFFIPVTETKTRRSGFHALDADAPIKPEQAYLLRHSLVALSTYSSIRDGFAWPACVAFLPNLFLDQTRIDTPLQGLRAKRMRRLLHENAGHSFSIR